MSKKSPVKKRKARSHLSSKFHEFITLHPPLQVSRHLRSVLLDYISQQINTGLPPDFHVYLWEFYDLFDLLDYAADDAEKKSKAQNPVK